ncbi:GntR family transcriptional regulator [Saccharothrix deserti]|uniref:GntR family transcriptional regulator n=1 Tax=Saccharothrix deserti TaxID=2593674 RepID=UPI00131B0F7A|nr:UTRA domain-containing protein [Saccharothrix deserti]
MTSNDTWVSVSTDYVKPRVRGDRDAWTQEAASYGRAGSQRLREVAEVEPPPAVAEALGVSAGESVVVRRRVMLLDGRPVELTDSYYPTAVARGTRLAEARKIPGGAPTLLADLGYELRYVDEDVSAQLATDDEQRLLGLVGPEPVIVLFRVATTTDGRPVEVSVMTMLAAGRHLRYRLTIGE